MYLAGSQMRAAVRFVANRSNVALTFARKIVIGPVNAKMRRSLVNRHVGRARLYVVTLAQNHAMRLILARRRRLVSP